MNSERTPQQGDYIRFLDPTYCDQQMKPVESAQDGRVTVKCNNTSLALETADLVHMPGTSVFIHRKVLEITTVQQRAIDEERGEC